MKRGVITLNSVSDLINVFDPGMINVGTSFFIVAGKYAMIYGIMGYVLKMIIKASTGKERFM